MSVQIYAGNLAYKITEDSLKEIFAQFGEVTSVKIIKDKMSGRSKGFGFVEMTSESSADAAIQKLNGSDVMGRNIKVNIARPKQERE